MQKLKPIIVAAVLFVVPGLAHARKVVVAEPENIGVDSDSSFTFADLVRDALQRKDGWEVVPRSATPENPCAETPCATEIARQTGAEATVVLALSRLGSKIVVRYGLVSAEGKVQVSDRTTALGLEDLDPLATRIATAVTERLDFDKTISVSTVTAEEATTPLRQSSWFSHGVGFGAVVPMGGSYGGAGYLTDVRLMSMYELRAFAAGLEADILWTPDDGGSSAGGLGINLAGKYFLQPELDIGPFIEAGMGVRFLAASERVPDPVDPTFETVNTDTANGLGAFIGGGVVMFRSADLHVVASGRYDVNFLQFHELDEGRQAHGLSVNVALTYTTLGSICPFF